MTNTQISENISSLQWQQTDSAQQEMEVANALAGFIQTAQSSVKIAIYDFRLKAGSAQDAVLGAIRSAAGGGVKVSIGYDAGKTPDTQEEFTKQGGDPAPSGNAEFLAALDGVGNIEMMAINAGHQLMHSKYVVVDAFTQHGAVWMGSANFTDDSWTKQENNILALKSADLAGFYANDFMEMFSQGTIKGTGKDDTGTVEIDGIDISIHFSPGQGKQIDSSISEAIRGAKERIYIASMVISSATILGAMNDALESGIEIKGIYDGTQMSSALHQMEKGQAASQAKAQLFKDVTKGFSAKKSTPYSAASAHDFMHNKVAIVDDIVFTGSYNFSLNATKNAENNLKLESKELADKYVAYVETLIAKYK